VRVMVAGATGAVGRALIPQLAAAGHEVVGTSRSASRLSDIDLAWAEGVVMDGLDRASVNAAVAAARPDVVVHQLSALAGMSDLKRFDRGFALTNRLRTEGTDHLLAAMREHGVRRIVAQSFTGWPNSRDTRTPAVETEPLDPNPTKASRETLAAIRYIEDVVTHDADIDGAALRYGTLYGPGTGFAEDGDLVQLIRQRKLPVVGGGTGIWSFVHVDDAASATVLAVARGSSAVYNIVDDDPAPVSVWLPRLAEIIGAPKPRGVPALLARPMIGEHGVSMMTKVRGSSNALAKAELGWRLRYPSWHDGFAAGLSRAA
jgi:nucleoside-diphosphate-sugar epimerase